MASRQKQKRQPSAGSQQQRPIDRAAPISTLPLIERSMPLISGLLWVYAILLMLGFVVFRTEGALVRGNKMSVDRAAFTVVNAGTLTGFQYSTRIDEYRWPGQLAILVLTAASTVVVLIIGGIFVTRIAKLPYSDRELIVAAAILELAVIIIGAPAAWLFGPHGLGAIAAMLQAASAFGNSGVWIGPLPTETQPGVHLLLLPLSILGGFGLPVLLDLLDVARGRRATLSRHTQLVLWTSAAIYLLATSLVLFLECVQMPPQTLQAFVRLLAGSSAAAINTRSAGLPINFAAEFPRTVQWVLMLLMAIGASPGSAGGGIKGTTVARLIFGMRETLARRAPGRGFGIACIWTIAFGGITLLALLLLLRAQPDQNADRLLLLAVSAASNTGLSHDRVSIVGPGLAALSATMLIGRMLSWLILWWLVSSAPEEDVAVG